MVHDRRKVTVVLSILGIAAPAGILLAAASAQDQQKARHDHYHELGDAAPKLLSAANAGDVDAVKSTYGDLGKACKNRHDTFRSPEDSPQRSREL
jgi:hypothetical protein